VNSRTFFRYQPSLCWSTESTCKFYCFICVL